MPGLEPGASRSQSARATNCATLRVIKNPNPIVPREGLEPSRIMHPRALKARVSTIPPPRQFNYDLVLEWPSFAYYEVASLLIIPPSRLEFVLYQKWILCAREESNFHSLFRRQELYPLSYGRLCYNYTLNEHNCRTNRTN